MPFLRPKIACPPTPQRCLPRLYCRTLHCVRVMPAHNRPRVPAAFLLPSPWWAGFCLLAACIPPVCLRAQADLAAARSECEKLRAQAAAEAEAHRALGQGPIFRRRHAHPPPSLSFLLATSRSTRDSRLRNHHSLCCARPNQRSEPLPLSLPLFLPAFHSSHPVGTALEHAVPPLMFVCAFAGLFNVRIASVSLALLDVFRSVRFTTPLPEHGATLRDLEAATRLQAETAAVLQQTQAHLAVGAPLPFCLLFLFSLEREDAVKGEWPP